MKVISEFVKNDLSEDQLLPVVNELVPSLLGILSNSQVRFRFLGQADISDPSPFYPSFDDHCLS